jgi:hypothetical protein
MAATLANPRSNVAQSLIGLAELSARQRERQREEEEVQSEHAFFPKFVEAAKTGQLSSLDVQAVPRRYHGPIVSLSAAARRQEQEQARQALGVEEAASFQSLIGQAEVDPLSAPQILRAVASIHPTTPEGVTARTQAIERLSPSARHVQGLFRQVEAAHLAPVPESAAGVMVPQVPEVVMESVKREASLPIPTTMEERQAQLVRLRVRPEDHVNQAMMAHLTQTGDVAGFLAEAARTGPRAFEQAGTILPRLGFAPLSFANLPQSHVGALIEVGRATSTPPETVIANLRSPDPTARAQAFDLYQKAAQLVRSQELDAIDRRAEAEAKAQFAFVPMTEQVMEQYVHPMTLAPPTPGMSRRDAREAGLVYVGPDGLATVRRFRDMLSRFDDMERIGKQIFTSDQLAPITQFRTNLEGFFARPEVKNFQRHVSTVFTIAAQEQGKRLSDMDFRVYAQVLPGMETFRETKTSFESGMRQIRVLWMKSFLRFLGRPDTVVHFRDRQSGAIGLSPLDSFNPTTMERLQDF